MEMDCQNKPPPSIIEMLMGLNTQPVQKRQRLKVLSDNYLQKTSSLRFSRQCLPSQTCSSAAAMQVDVTDLVPTVGFVDQICNADYQICRSDSMCRSSRRDSQDTSLHPRQSKIMKLQNPPTFENSPEIKISRVAKKSQQKHKHIPFKPSNGRFSVKKYKEPEGPEQAFMSEIVNKNLEAPKISESTVSSLPASRIRKDENYCSPVPAKGNWIMTHRSLIRPRAHWDTNRYLISEKSARTTASNPRLHITECNGSSIPCNSEPLSTNQGSSPGLMSDNGSVQAIPSNKSKIRRCYQNVSDGTDGVYESLLEPSSSDFSRLKDCEIGLANQTLATQNDHTYGSCAKQIGLLICDADDTCQKASQSLSDLASCPTPEPLSPTSSESEEVSHCSPISVLELISKGGVPSTMDCFMNGSNDLYGVYSEGLGMVVSSDEDNREESMDAIEDNAELSDWSYLVSVLGEACGGFEYVNYSKWHSFEKPITPLVFQILEEKYGRHVSWPRSERMLLFDRINLGLTDTAKSCFSIRHISASLKQRFFPCWTRKEVQENLWRLLITQDKEATKTNDIKPLKGKNSTATKVKKSNKGIKVSEGDSSFLQLEDYMDEIIIDIERSLLDDLVSKCL